MTEVNYSEIKEKKRIAMIFSMICPGMGLIYYEKWILGFFHTTLHVVFGFFFICQLIYYIIYQLDDHYGFMLSLLLGALIINWLISLIYTMTYKPDE